MFLEYFKYAYNNAFRYPRRFVALIIGVALATFGILSLLAVTTNLQKSNDHKIYELEHGNINVNQLFVLPQTIEKPVSEEFLAQINSYPEVDKAYYFEDFSYYLWQYDYLIPWINLDSKLNLELKSILLDINSAKEYGLAEKIVYGSYFTDNPNEVILSISVLKAFIKEEEVFNNNLVVLTDSIRQGLKQGKGEAFTPDELIGETVSFTYNFNFELDEEKNYKVTEPESVDLIVVGIFDPSIGYQTIGDAWLPIELKESLSKLESNQNTAMGKQIIVRAASVATINNLKKSIEMLGFATAPTIEENTSVQNQLIETTVRKLFMQIALVATIIISLISLMVTIVLMITERQYDFFLRRALGADKNKIVFLFTIEIFFITFVASLFGLLLTLLFLQSGLDELLDFSFYLAGGVAFLTIIGIPLVSVLVSAILLNNSFKKQVNIGLARGS